MDGTPVLNRIRDAIVDDPATWKKAKQRVELHDDMKPLKTAPKGYDKNHPLIADLKRTTFAANFDLTKAEFTGDLMRAFQKGYGEMAPMLKFLEKAMK